MIPANAPPPSFACNIFATPIAMMRHRPEAQVVDGRCEPELVEAEDHANENDEESDDELRGDAKSRRGGGGLQLDHD